MSVSEQELINPVHNDADLEIAYCKEMTPEEMTPEEWQEWEEREERERQWLKYRIFLGLLPPMQHDATDNS